MAINDYLSRDSSGSASGPLLLGLLSIVVRYYSTVAELFKVLALPFCCRMESRFLEQHMSLV
jgi:hypothetical protein